MSGDGSMEARVVSLLWWLVRAVAGLALGALLGGFVALVLGWIPFSC